MRTSRYRRDPEIPPTNRYPADEFIIPFISICQEGNRTLKNAAVAKSAAHQSAAVVKNAAHQNATAPASAEEENFSKKGVGICRATRRRRRRRAAPIRCLGRIKRTPSN